MDQGNIYRTIFERSDIGVYQTLIEGGVVEANPAMARMFGYETAEEFAAATGTSNDKFYVRRSDRDWHIAELKRSGRVSAHVCEMKRRDGSRFWVSDSTTLAQDPDGRLSILGTMVDVTDLVESQRAFREAEARYRSIIDNALEGVYISSLDGRMIVANRALAEINGYDSPEELILSVKDIGSEWYVRPERRQEFVDAMARDGEVRNFESEVYRHKTRERIWVQENARLVSDESGKALYYEGTVQEITQRKNFERQLMVARRAAEASNRAKSEFLANMSHELRTPLNAIMGFAQILRDRWNDPEHTKVSEYSGDILLSAQHLYGLISEILDYSKIDSGTVQLVEGPIDVVALCNHCSHMISERAQRAGLKLKVALADDLPALQADERRITQVLLNLATNAVKFTPAGGTVTIGADVEPSGNLVLSVADSGIGISEKDIERVFEPFVQVNRNAHPQQEGAGLGLAICKNLIELHQGRIEVSSKPQRGTTVRVILPASRLMPVRAAG
ncbi:PAS domain-containing sensor histidine kinase [Dongia sedimenti]|uniref:histidine kinase n=1 Tax=Dongia sedimenti TaxID=3064282 RepID=A0ABU0YT68_9PROT|nr:PAS domain-containing sensor histidine kinase [Rhodospirillaceae bacterium R-7]